PPVNAPPQYVPGYAQPTYPPPAYPPIEPPYPPPSYAYPSPPKKSHTGLIIGIIAGVLVLCCGIGAVFYYVGRKAFESLPPSPTVTAAVSPTPPGVPAGPPTAPPAEPTGEAPSGETFRLAPGTKVVFTDRGDEFEITVSD